MKRKLIKCGGFIIVALLAFACSYIIYEDDLSKEILFIIMPVHGTKTDVQEQVFWWETLEGVIKYRLQIVEGSFREPYYFVADTNIAGDKFIIDLLPGSYEWRIQGWNNYSETVYFNSVLTITDTLLIHEE
jgi:hypothetical protein